MRSYFQKSRCFRLTFIILDTPELFSFSNSQSSHDTVALLCILAIPCVMNGLIFQVASWIIESVLINHTKRRQFSITPSRETWRKPKAHWESMQIQLKKYWKSLWSWTELLTEVSCQSSVTTLRDIIFLFFFYPNTMNQCTNFVHPVYEIIYYITSH